MISLIIPAYNEAARIRSTIGDAIAYFRGRGLPLELIVSADGTDGTREAALEMRATHPAITVIGSAARQGKGRGIREAVRLATGAIIGFTDADNKTPIAEYDKVVEAFARGSQIVIGSRGLHESRIERPQPLYRQIGSRGFGWFMRAAVGLPSIVDTQCGFKFFTREVAKDLFQLQQIDGYMFDVEILYLAQRRGYRIEEVPVRWRDDADSRLDLVAGNLVNVRDILSIRWRHRQVPERAGLASDPVSGQDS